MSMGKVPLVNTCSPVSTVIKCSSELHVNSIRLYPRVLSNLNICSCAKGTANYLIG